MNSIGVRHYQTGSGFSFSELIPQKPLCLNPTKFWTPPVQSSRGFVFSYNVTQVQSSKVHSSRLKSGIFPKVSIPGRMRSSSDFCDRPVLHGIPDLHAIALGKARQSGRTLCRHGSRVHIGQHKGANPDFIGKP